MADNITVTAGSYTGIIGTKEIANVHYQKVAVVDSNGVIVSGGFLGATDTEDGATNAGQSAVALTFSLPYLWDGLKWVRAIGYTTHRTVSVASTNATSVKGSAAVLYGWYVTNTNQAPRYLKLYNKASAPVIGTDVPTHTILIPGNASGAGSTIEFKGGVAFATGLAFGVTSDAADADVGIVNANEVVIHLFYR